MVLRLLLSAAIVLNPAAAVMAESSPQMTPVRGTHIFATNAPDWIVEGAAERLKNNQQRALELFNAAKTQLLAEKLPEPYAREIIYRLDDLITSAGGTANNGGLADPNDPVNSGLGIPIGSMNPKKSPGAAADNHNRATQNSSADDFGKDLLLEPTADTNHVDTTIADSDVPVPDTKVPITDPRGTYLISEHDPKVLNDVLKNAPEIREILWWINSARLAAHARTNRLRELIRRELGEDELSKMDSFGSGYGGFGYGNMEPGAVYDVLAYFGILDKDYHQKVLKLKQRYDGARPQDLAQLLVEEATLYSAASGGIFGLAHSRLKKAGPSTGAGDTFSTGGASKAQLLSDEILALLINAGYMTQMAALYDVEIDQVEKHLIGMVALGFSMFVVKHVIWGKNGPKIPKESLFSGLTKALDRVSPRLGKMARNLTKSEKPESAGELGTLAKEFRQFSPNMEQIARNFDKARKQGRGPEYLNEVLEGMVASLADAPGSAGAIGAGRISGSDRGPVLSNDPLDPVDPTDPVNKPKKPRAPRKPKPKTPKAWALELAGALMSGVGNAALTGGVSFGAMSFSMDFFNGLYKKRQELSNKVFLQGMNSHKKIPFLKLMIHSMQLGRNEMAPFTARRDKNPQVAYILNLARSLGICSEQDFVVRDAAVKAGAKDRVAAAKAALAEHARKRSASRQEAETVAITGIDVKKILHSCPEKHDSKNWNLLMREMKSFTSIPDTSVAHLRTSILRDRVKMAQLYLQFMYVDGEPTQQEMEFYQSVVSRLIGFDSKEQGHYISLLAGFIHKSGGIVENPESPTGFSIAKVNQRMESPYDYKKTPGSAEAPFEILAVDWDDATDVSGLR